MTEQVKQMSESKMDEYWLSQYRRKYESFMAEAIREGRKFSLRHGMNEQVKKLWADSRFQLLVDIDKLLNGDRIWAGMEWHYNPIHSFKYRPVAEKVRKALDDLKKEYGVEE